MGDAYMNQVYTSIELGTDSVKIVVMEKVRDKFHVLASVHSPSEGISRGQVVDIKKCVSSVRVALKRVNDMLGIKVIKVIAVVPPEGCKFDIAVGSIDVIDKITGDDINRVVKDRNLIVSDEIRNKLDSYIYFKDRYSRYKTVTEDYLSIFEGKLRSCADNDGYYLVINLAYDEGMKAYYYDVSIYTLEAFKKEYINDLKDLRNNYLYSLNHYDDRSIVDKEGYRDFLWLRKKYSGLSSEELSIIDDEILKDNKGKGLVLFRGYDKVSKKESC